MKQAQQKTQEQSETRRNYLTGILIGALFGVGIGVIQNSIVIGLSTGLPIAVAIGIFLERRLPLMKFPIRFFRRILFAIVLFVVSLNSILFLPETFVKKWNILLYLLSAASWFLVVFFISQAIASLDEMQRRIQTEAVAIGFACTAVIAMGYGIASLLFELVSVNWIFIIMAMTFCWLIGKVWTLRKYGG